MNWKMNFFINLIFDENIRKIEYIFNIKKIDELVT